jgi:hypothetical protein
MLKSILITAVCSLIVLNSFCQTFEGKWGGSFAYYYKNTKQTDGVNNFPISLDITLNKDSSYAVHTEFKGFDTDRSLTKIKCSALFEIINTDSIFIKELIVNSPKNGDKKGLKKMYLKIVRKKDKLFLEGSFETYLGETIYTGEIWFYKK